MFAIHDLLVFIPAGYPADTTQIDTSRRYKKWAFPKEWDSGILNIHVFEYTDLSKLTDHRAAIRGCANVLLVVDDDGTFSNEVEYSDYLNEILPPGKYTALSVSKLHASPTEQKPTQNRARIIRRSNPDIIGVINENLQDWFDQDAKHIGGLSADRARHIATTHVEFTA